MLKSNIIRSKALGGGLEGKRCVVAAFLTIVVLLLFLSTPSTPPANRNAEGHGGVKAAIKKQEEKMKLQDTLVNRANRMQEEKDKIKAAYEQKKKELAAAAEKVRATDVVATTAEPDSDVNATLDARNKLWKCETTKGPIVIRLRFDWAPHGAKRMQELLELGFFTNMTFFRVPPLPSNPIAQFGMSPLVTVRGRANYMKKIEDDPFPAGHATAKEGPAFQKKGHFAYGGSGKNSRTYHMWVARDDFTNHSPALGRNIWDMSVAETIRGREVWDKIEQVGDMKPWGNGPDTHKMHQDKSFNHPEHFPGSYLKANYPKIDWFKGCYPASYAS